MEEVEVVCSCARCETAREKEPIEISGNNRVLDFIKYISKVARKTATNEPVE